MGEASLSARRQRRGFGRDIGRPIVAYFAAATVAAVMVDVGVTLGPLVAGSIVRRPASYPDGGVALYLAVNFLIALGITLVTAAAPAVVASWIARAVAAPRPLTDIVFGAVLGPLLLVGVMAAYNNGSIPLDMGIAGLGVVGYFALAGGVAAFVYALIVGPRA